MIAEEIKRLEDQGLKPYSTKPVDGAESAQISPHNDFGRYDNAISVAKVSEAAGDSHTTATVSESAILSNETEQSGNTIPGELSTSNGSLDTDSIDSTVDSVLQPLIPNNDS